MASNFIPKLTQIGADDPEDVFSVELPQVYSVRKCSSCGSVLFSEPGDRDAHCSQCGVKIAALTTNSHS